MGDTCQLKPAPWHLLNSSVIISLPASPVLPTQSPQSASLTFGEGTESPGGQSCQPAKETKVCTLESGSHQSPALPKSPPGSKAADGTSVVPPEEEEEEEGGKDGIRPSNPQPPQPSTGPASRAAGGSSNSIPFIDCSDVDSEYDLLREPGSQSRSQTNDNYEGDLTSGVYLLSRDERQAETRRRASPPSTKSSRPPSGEFLVDDSADITFDLSGSPGLPRHSSLIDEMFRASTGHSPLATPLSPCSRSSSPDMSWDRTRSQGYVSENGHDLREKSMGEDTIPKQGPPSENSSPALQRPYLRNLPSRYNKSETDPLILSQAAPTPEAMERFDDQGEAGLAHMATLQGMMLANGTQPTGSTSEVTLLQAVHTDSASGQLAPLQVTECSTSSGNESSDSDSAVVSPSRKSPVLRHPTSPRSPLRKGETGLQGLRLGEEEGEHE